MEFKIGDKIRIIHMDDASGKDKAAWKYNGKEGYIQYIDDIGQIHGTWGSLAVIPGIDEIELIEENNYINKKVHTDKDNNTEFKRILKQVGDKNMCQMIYKWLFYNSSTNMAEDLLLYIHKNHNID